MSAEPCVDCEPEERAVDNTEWDGGAAMTACTNSDTPGTCFGAICAGRKDGPPEQRSSWALPHHKRPGAPPNAAAVRNALARLSQTEGLTNASDARSHLEGHMASIQSQSASRPPRDDLVRAAPPGSFELREAAERGGMPTMTGHFAVFNEWTQIDSAFEGRFMERIAPGAFSKTFAEHRDGVRVLFQHGRDPHIGDKVLGPITELREDEHGAFYEVPLLDTAYNRELLPGLEAMLYGSSFRFRVIREDIEDSPKRSKANPDAIPERTVREAQVYEFGPVTFPAYAGATAGVRSMTDEYVFGRFTADARKLADIIDYTRESRALGTTGENSVSVGADVVVTTTPVLQEDVAPSDPTPAEATSGERRDDETKEEHMPEEQKDNRGVEELQVEVAAISAELEQRAAEYGTELLTKEQQADWDAKIERRRYLEARIEAAEKRRREVEDAARLQRAREQAVVTPKPYEFEVERKPRRSEVYDMSTIRMSMTDPQSAARELRDKAMQVVEWGSYSEEISKEDAQTKVAGLLDHHDTDDAKLARRIVLTGHPTYQRAFWKKVGNQGLAREETEVLERAMTATTEGAIAVPFELDPTVILASNGVANPIRQIARVESIVGETWKGITTLGVTASYATEAAEASDNAPTLVQPTVTALRAQAFIPFSVELGQDWGSLRSEMTTVLVDSKDVLEATMFASGTGSPQPQGILVGGTNTTKGAGSATFAVADLYTLEEALPPRFRPNARFVANKYIFNKVRQFDTQGGASLWVQLQRPQPPELIGYPAHELSTMAAALTSGTKIAVLGDWSKFLIVDRVGMDVELIPHLFGTSHFPTGQRGFYALWRNSSVVLQANAFRILYTGP